jgi:hypothetical protein
MRAPSRPDRIPLTVLSLLLALGAVPACRDATPAAPEESALPAPRLSTAKKPDKQDYVQTFTRDVYVIVGSTLRNPDDATADPKPLFNVAGVALGVTWGDWKRASAASTAHVTGPSTQASIELTGLIPRGVYSVFYVNLDPDSENPLCPGVERALPLQSVSPKQSPDAASFVAGQDGTASFHARVPGDLFAPLQLLFEVVYHSDGRTYGSLPNRGEFLTQGAGCRSSYGEDAMRQLLIVQKGP